MPKKKKGKKKGPVTKRKTPETTLGQEFCVCVRPLGNRRFRIRFPGGAERLGILAGRVRRNQYIQAGTWVIASLRTYEDAKCDIFDVLTPDEVRVLKKTEQIDPHLAVGINGLRAEDEDESGFDIAAEDEDLAGIEDLINSA